MNGGIVAPTLALFASPTVRPHEPVGDPRAGLRSHTFLLTPPLHTIPTPQTQDPAAPEPDPGHLDTNSAYKDLPIVPGGCVALNICDDPLPGGNQELKMLSR